MSGIVLHLRNGLPASLAPDYRVKSKLLLPSDWTQVGIGKYEVIVPTDTVWIPLSIRFNYTTSASVTGTRNIHVIYYQYDTATSTYVEAVRNFSHAFQSDGTTYSYGAHLAAENMVSPIGSANYITFNLHDFALNPQDKIVIEDSVDVVHHTVDTLTIISATVLEHSSTA